MRWKTVHEMNDWSWNEWVVNKMKNMSWDEWLVDKMNAWSMRWKTVIRWMTGHEMKGGSCDQWLVNEMKDAATVDARLQIPIGAPTLNSILNFVSLVGLIVRHQYASMFIKRSQYASIIVEFWADDQENGGCKCVNASAPDDKSIKVCSAPSHQTTRRYKYVNALQQEYKRVNAIRQ